MKTLLEQRHPDISFRIAGYCKMYKRCDIHGNILEALERKDFNEDFVDVTAREQERQKIERAIEKEEAEIRRVKRQGAISLHIDDKTNRWTDDDGNIYDVIVDSETGERYLYRPNHATAYIIVDDTNIFNLLIKEQ